MIPVKVDISNPIDRYDLNQDQANRLSKAVVDSLANSFADNMKAIAKTKLNQTRQAFIDGINVLSISNSKSAVELTGFLPNAVTMGSTPFDMKEGFAKSGKKKTKKDGGWYLTIPFRMATPNAVASSTVFSGVMPTSVYNLAKKLGEKKSLSAKSLPTEHSAVGTRSAVQSGDRRFEPYVHKAPIYAGITKSTAANHVTYSSFRRVSDKSDQDSWIHTGIEAKNIHLDAIDRMDIPTVVKMAVDDFLDRR